MPVKVLLVDDSAVIRGLMSKALSADSAIEIAGTAGNGTMAISMARDMQPDIIVLDMNMPILTGADCVARIKSNPRLKDIPVVIYSTDLDEPQVQHLYEAGVSRIIPKRVDNRALWQELRTLFPPVRA